ncbi:MAG: hypothetical protein EBS55_06995 [Flavobacteriaceae bacterium]|nr:hypothetical protein [Flavobacteriaceae bacterium]
MDENLNVSPHGSNTMLAEVPEYLLCSAIWFDDGIDTYVHQPRNIKTGFVVCGRRHHNCFTIKAMLQGVGRKDYKDEVQGFLTNKDRFVDRYEAAQIALASGQIKEPTERLYSEDVW